MRILIADTYYEGFLEEYYRRHPKGAELPYAEQHAHLMAQHFGTGDAYAVELRRLGSEAHTLALNVKPLQEAWAGEHDLPTGNREGSWRPDVLLAQVRDFRPDVVYVQELSAARDEMWREVRRLTRLVVGQIACSLPANRTFEHHDLIISSWPPIVEHFRTRGKAAEFLPLAFDRGVLDALGEVAFQFDVSFVGGLSPAHGERIAWLENVCRDRRIDVFGYGAEQLAADSPIRACHRGEAWGLEMYRVLAASKITLNHHLAHEVGGRRGMDLANNCRLFEATGAGTCLVTDAKQNLGEFFEAGVEVETYADAEDCAARIEGLLDDESRRRSIARAGRTRTVVEHSYARRMETLLDILEFNLRSARA